MRKQIALIFGLLLLSHPLRAVPSDMFWTYCTTDVYNPGVGNVAVINNFSVFNRRHHGAALPVIAGLEFGLFALGDWNVEAGIDYWGGTDDPLYFNTKIGIVEDKLFKHAPSMSVGIFNVGTRARHTNQNVVDLIFGKTLPEAIGGRLFVGGFHGNQALGKTRFGMMVAYIRTFCPAVHCDGTQYFKWALAADYASGKNQIGGGGIGLFHYFTPDVLLETGPIWFNTAKYNGSWKWSVQIYINFPVKPKNC